MIYAGDTVVFCPSLADLQWLIDECSEYINFRRLTIDAQKQSV